MLNICDTRKKMTGKEAKMDTEQLKNYLAVAQLGSFQKVADQKFISQRTVSKQMANLEDELGVQLFFRGPNKVTLTNAGNYFVQRATELLNLVPLLREHQGRPADGAHHERPVRRDRVRAPLPGGIFHRRAENPCVVRHPVHDQCSADRDDFCDYPGDDRVFGQIQSQNARNLPQKPRAGDRKSVV